MPARRLRLRQTANRRDVEAFIAKRGGNLSLCRKAAKYIYGAAGMPKDIEGLRALRAELFEPGESAGNLDKRIADLEAEPTTNQENERC